LFCVCNIVCCFDKFRELSIGNFVRLNPKSINVKVKRWGLVGIEWLRAFAKSSGWDLYETLQSNSGR